jgi:4-amino-4-deoxy-L-arabinose transferase-like glycosyltransferase
MWGRRISFLVCVLVAFTTLAARVLGPGDLYDKDQPKTTAGSADVALNGNWVWPRDMLLEPSTKPPLYNWLDAVVLRLSPRWDEWTFKVPSMMATLGIAGMIVVATRRLLRDHKYADVIALVAAAIWLANVPVMKQGYLSRPDMLMTAFLTGAWFCATRLLDSTATLASRDRPQSRELPLLSLAFSLCVAGAALSKGPAAFLPIVYVPVAAILLRRKPSLTMRRHWLWVGALVLAFVGGWAFLAYRHWPAAFWGVLASEGTSRFQSGGPEGIAKPFHLPALWFVTKFLPWSLAAGVAVLLIGPKNWLRHELAPAIMWIVLVVVAFSVAPGKRPDYLLPAYPAASILAAYGMIEVARRLRIPVVITAAAPLLFAVYLAHFELRRSPEAKSRQTQSLVAFANDVRRIVPADDRVVFLVKGYHPLLSLLRRHEGNRARPADLADGTWVIAPHDPAWPAHATSGTLPDVVQVAPKKMEPGRMSLYRIGVGNVTRDVLLPMLADQYEWNFPPDRYRASRDPLPPSTSPPSAPPSTRSAGGGSGGGF